MPVEVRRLGLVEYEDGLSLQRRFQEARRAGAVGDTLLLLQHNPVITLGRAGKRGNVLADGPTLGRLGVELHETDRGGDVTFHGPGQVVGYPLFHLGPGKQDVRRYVRDVEEVMIRACAGLGVAAHREPKWPGIWVQASRLGGLRKIGAVGVHLSRWYTRHGFALNAQPDLSLFGLIVPCGIREAGVTSLSAELGRAVAVEEVEPLLGEAAGEVFGGGTAWRDPDQQTISVVVVDGGGEVLLLKRRADRGGFWQPITGRVEPGEAPAEAAARELGEETGLTVPLEPLDYRHAFTFGEEAVPRVYEETAFLARAPREAPIRLDGREHEAHGWRTFDGALELVPYAGLREALRRARGRA